MHEIHAIIIELNVQVYIYIYIYQSVSNNRHNVSIRDGFGLRKVWKLFAS